MPTAKKAAIIEDLTDKLGRINAAALIDYRGLTVAEIGTLRTQLRERGVELQVTKNTLLREAAHRNNMTSLDDLFAGPAAVAFIYGDESTATKAINDFFRTARVGSVKSGILKGGRAVSAEQLAKLADLPNRQTLLAQIAGLLESPLAQLAALFNAPAQQFAYALTQFEEKGGAGVVASAAAPAPAVSAAETSAAAEPAASAEAEAPVATPPAQPEVEAAAVSIAPGPVETAEDATANETAEPAAGATDEAPLAAEPPAQAEVVAADTSSAPESEGGAANEAAAAEAPQDDATPGAADEAAGASSAPESAGSADATA